MRFRGIQFESMQPGSEFVDGEVPDFQVGIYNAGAFVDTFIGYGVRFRTILVVPTHVVRHAQMMVIEGKTGKIGISVAPVHSRVHSDLTYFPLTEVQWSKVGVSQARVPKKVLNALVSCTGRKGSTSGLLTRVEGLGIMKYAGSTVGGMSGAAYYSGQTVHGIHTGSTGAFNVGVSSLLIEGEIKKLVIGETPTLDDLRGLNRASAAKVRAGWNTEGLLKQIDEIYSKDCEWAEDFDLDYGAQLDFEAGEEATVSEKWLGTFIDLPINQQQNALAAMQSIVNAKRMATGQSDNEDTPVVLPKDFATMRFEALEKRVSFLEEWKKESEKRRVSPGTLQKDSTLPFVCGFEGEDEQGVWRCRKGFLTNAARLQHQIVKGHVVGESAFGGDVKPAVATRPVFRKRPVSQIRNSKNWRSTSNSAEQQSPSSSQQQNPSSTQDLVVETLKNLLGQLQGMGGHTSGTTPNCRV